MPLSDAQAVELTRRYQRSLVALSTASEARLQAIWDHLGTWDDTDVERFLAQSTPTVTATQQRATSLTFGFLGLLLGSAVAAKVAHAVVDFRDPFIGYWTALKDGQPWEQAITLGRTRAETLVRFATNTAARDTNIAVDQLQNPRVRITGWRRVLTGPSSCEFCAVISTQRYHTAQAAGASNHSGRCDCTVLPIIGTQDPGRVINHSLLSSLKQLGDNATGYVTSDGHPAPRPDAAPVSAP